MTFDALIMKILRKSLAVLRQLPWGHCNKSINECIQRVLERLINQKKSNTIQAQRTHVLFSSTVNQLLQFSDFFEANQFLT